MSQKTSSWDEAAEDKDTQLIVHSSSSLRSRIEAERLPNQGNWMGNALGMQQQSWTGTRLCVLQAGKQATNTAISHVKSG